ncbi:DUF761-associated sequence motif [Carex littledalei]|uniref:DUF761-associated sequence motif n=1 Tax=Carex littledalei TaxID=544730 RepID=A0A833RM02_9POAL|nr:DUF761-associated sequence motif [Carex littledalei]
MKMKSPSSNSFQFSSHEHTFGCVSAILRHFRCRQRIPINENYNEVVELSTGDTKAQSPNIVARLMGLDSMPISTNSTASSWPEIMTERTNASPAKSSVSFHEKPIYLREENEEFLILSFTPDENGKENLSNWGNCTSNARNIRRSRRKQSSEKSVRDSCQKKENFRKLQRVSKKDGIVKCEENGELPLIFDLEKIKFIQRKVETESLSQNSSPVSVLDLPETHDECPTEPNSPNSDAQGAGQHAKQGSSRRKLSSNFENLEGSFSDSHFEANEESNKLISCGTTICNQIVWKHFVDEDLKNSIWVEREIKKPVHAEEIAVEIGMEILDLLISETTSEICSNFN